MAIRRDKVVLAKLFPLKRDPESKLKLSVTGYPGPSKGNLQEKQVQKLHVRDQMVAEGKAEGAGITTINSTLLRQVIPTTAEDLNG